MLNQAVLLAAADSIEKGNKPYDYADWDSCVCGHIAAVMGCVNVYHSTWITKQGENVSPATIATAVGVDSYIFVRGDYCRLPAHEMADILRDIACGRRDADGTLLDQQTLPTKELCELV